MCKVFMYFKNVSDKMQENEAPIANTSFWVIILLLAVK
jgi:hypothetical protein